MLLQSQIEAHTTAPLHSQFCSCTDCQITRDPMTFHQGKRTLRLQAAVLIVFLAVIYGLFALNAPAIAVSFGIGQ